LKTIALSFATDFAPISFIGSEESLMKTVIASVVSLMIGLGVGWLLASSAASKKARETALVEEQMTQLDLHTISQGGVCALSAVEFIDAGEYEKAIERLGDPIAGCRNIYGTLLVTASERSNVLARVENASRKHPSIARELFRQSAR
jgi:hypothetical protein